MIIGLTRMSGPAAGVVATCSDLGSDATHIEQRLAGGKTRQVPCEQGFLLRVAGRASARDMGRDDEVGQIPQGARGPQGLDLGDVEGRAASLRACSAAASAAPSTRSPRATLTREAR